MQSPITLGLIAVTALVSWLAFKDRRLVDRLILWPPAVSQRHQYWRLASYGLLHADVSHLLFNMITLFFFGRLIEQVMVQLTGSWLTYPLFYLTALVVSILPSYLKNQKNPKYFSLGASGAVSAVLFAFILFDPWSKLIIFPIPVPIPAILFAVIYVGYSIWMDRRGGGNVNHSAHLWGAAYGVLFTVLLEPRILGHFVQTLLRTGSP